MERASALSKHQSKFGYFIMSVPQQSIELSEDEILVDTLISRARIAQQKFEKGADQARYDRAALAAALTRVAPLLLLAARFLPLALARHGVVGAEEVVVGVVLVG